MTLDKLSQITEVGIKSGITLRNINVEGAYVSGVVTATTLTITDGFSVSGVVTATSFDGNVTGNITPSGLVVSGVSTFQASSFWGDGDIAYFGDGQDLLIFHNSTDSIIRDNGTGDLFIEGGNRIKLTNPTGIETYAVFNQDGASELWYDNVKRLETSGIGVSITSALTVGTGASISSPSTNVLTLGTNNTESVRINSTGVGIGTNNPTTTLDVGGEITIRRTAAGNEGGQINFARASDNAVAWNIDAYGSTSTPSLRFIDATIGASRVEIDGSGNLKLPTAGTKILNSSGNPILQQTGSILQVVTARNGDYYSTTSTSFTDITGLSLNITPTSSTSKIFLQLSLGRATTNLNNLDYICVLRILANGSDAININGNSSGSRIRGCMNVQGLAFNADHSPGGWSCSALESPGTTSTITYKAQVVCQGSSYAFIMNGTPNNSDTGATYHYRAQSSLTAWEIAG